MRRWYYYDYEGFTYTLDTSSCIMTLTEADETITITDPQLVARVMFNGDKF